MHAHFRKSSEVNCLRLQNDINEFFRIVRICLMQRRIVDNSHKPFIIESENRFQWRLTTY